MLCEVTYVVTGTTVRAPGAWGTPATLAGVPAVRGCVYTFMGQFVLMAVSSTTKEVCSEASSVPVNFTVTVVPAKLPSE
jgi:hypothetical protein